jgi:GT2 family glycosyltransferase
MSETEGATVPADFDETAYLTAFPKIAENIRAGIVKSALDHYLRKGAAEKRLEQPRYRKILAEQQLLARLAAPSGPSAEGEAPVTRGTVSSMLDTLMVTPGGICLAIGWVDDRGTNLSAVSVQMPNGRTVESTTIARCRRIDAESMIGCGPGVLLGFYALIELGQDEPPGHGSIVQLHCGGDPVGHVARPNLVSAEALRDGVFEYLSAATYFGNHAVETFRQLDGGMGDRLIWLNKSISAGIASRAYVERHGSHDRAFRGSIVVCLFGRLEYLFLQAAIFSTAPGADEYEYVYVCNSPELTEALQREARMAAKLYGLAFTIVFLPGNAGFGAANNVAVAHAASDRVLIVNPDVFPRDNLWAERHSHILRDLPEEQTRFFGAPLFYDDGSLMHGGMFIASDTGLSVRPEGIVPQELLRVEHYGKGAPPGMAFYRQSRRVTAVTGAFISADRRWFQKIGGFSEDYVFGHYEDADIGLKSWAANGQVWIHDLPLWHMEGKGSVRRAAHDGGSMINRWHFTRTWLAAVRDGYGGPNPARIAS